MTKTARGSLVVVGTGICGAGQTTLEALECMRQADRLYYSVADPVTEAWISQVNPGAENLSRFYGENKNRRETYADMTRTVIEAVTSGARVCAVFYGHPGVFVQPSHAAIQQLRALGYSARMLPGVSADACLFSDLGINPGDLGMQNYEATDFLLSGRRVDPTGGLILWQIGVLGEARLSLHQCRPARLQRLADALRNDYPATHEVVLYVASTFPGHGPMITRVALGDLPRTPVFPAMTMYVPPLPQRSPDPAILAWFAEA